MPAYGYIIIALVVLLILLVVLYFVGNNMQKKQLAQKEQLTSSAQTMSMLIIDKKYMKLKDANLPKLVLEQTPKRMRGAKLPIVKAKIGPKVMTLICDDAIYDQVPIKCEVKAQVSGIYIIGVKNVRGGAVVEEPKKKGFRAKLRQKQLKYQDEYAKEEKLRAQEKAAKAAKKAKNSSNGSTSKTTSKNSKKK